MKRALIVGVSTIGGVTAVLALNPTGQSASGATGAAALFAPATTGTTSSATTAAPAPSATASASASARAGAKASSTATPKATATATPKATATATKSSAEKTVTGTAVESGYGPVQVQITGTATSITAVTIIQAPQNDRHSLQISQYAVPQLQSQALSAQSASIDGVSGATYTTMAFERSLTSALQKLQG